MAIKVTKLNQHGQVLETREEYVGRVLEVRRYREVRNMSDTLDYSDHQTVDCCDALVWLGTRAPKPYGSRYDELHPSSYGEDVDLEFHQQFAWVNCSNHFVWRGEDKREPEVDAVVGKSEPLMFANHLAWQAWKKVQAEAAAKRAAEELKLRQAEEAKVAARKAKRQATDDAKKAAAEALLAKVPAKGSRVTVGDFAGKVAWTGVSKYYGKWGARVGVKNAKGEMAWFSADEVVGR